MRTAAVDVPPKLHSETATHDKTDPSKLPVTRKTINLNQTSSTFLNGVFGVDCLMGFWAPISWSEMTIELNDGLSAGSCIQHESTNCFHSLLVSGGYCGLFRSLPEEKTKNERLDIYWSRKEEKAVGVGGGGGG